MGVVVVTGRSLSPRRSAEMYQGATPGQAGLPRLGEAANDQLKTFSVVNVSGGSC